MSDTTALPDFTTPADLAEHMGISPRRVREIARTLGATHGPDMSMFEG